MPARSKSNPHNAVLARLTCVLGSTALLVALSAGAGSAVTTSTTSVPAGPPPELLTGISVSGATVNTPGAKPRTLDANQATALMQSWVAYSVFQKPPNERPPASLPVSRLSVMTDSQGTWPILYASDGTSAWVGAQGTDAAATFPNNEKWIRAPGSAANDRGLRRPARPDPHSSAGADHGRRPRRRRALPTPRSSDNSRLWLLVALGAAAIVVGGAILVVRVRRRTPVTDPSRPRRGGKEVPKR